MGQDPSNTSAVEDLRHDIDRTRANLGETAAALGAKADVKSRAKERVQEIKSNVSAKAPSSAGGAASQASATVKQNPVPTAAIAALVVGFALGWMIASHRAG
jgi:ElaB/YqjD/DUF883 family membrane-anchored ribosome-binding protein